MRIKSRRGLSRDGQGPRPTRKQVLPVLGPVTPIAKPRPPRAWSRTNDRLRDMGDFTVLIDTRVLSNSRTCGRGRAYHDSVIQAALIVSALFHLPLRQTEGMMRGIVRVAGGDPDGVPDYTTICRRRKTLHPPDLADLPAGVPIVLVIDSTGARLDSRDRWLDEKPGATGDPRRGWYRKVHVGIDSDTGRIVVAEVTKASGKGTGDPSVGRTLISKAYEHTQECHTHLNGGLGDGAYDDQECYRRMRQYGGCWYAPLPENAQIGSTPDRDRHVVGQRRLGETYEDRLGYHQRSCVESTMGALKKTVGLRTRAKSFEMQRLELLTQIWCYDQGLVGYPR